MDKVKYKNTLSIFEKIYLYIKGKKDGKNGNFEKKNGIYISPFIYNEMCTYNRICKAVKTEYMKDLNENVQIVKREIDEMKLEFVGFARKIAQIENRLKMLDENHDQEEIIDLYARKEQLKIDEDARTTSHRNIGRESISKLEILLIEYEEKISLKRAHYYQRQMKYLEYAGKYDTDLKTGFTSIENICNACGIREPFEEDRKTIECFKGIIKYDTYSSISEED